MGWLKMKLLAYIKSFLFASDTSVNQLPSTSKTRNCMYHEINFKNF